MFVYANGVVLDCISVEGLESEFVYDDSGVDHLYTRTTLSCTALLNFDCQGWARGQTPTAAYVNALERLRAPRKKVVLFALTRLPDAGAEVGVPMNVNGPNTEYGRSPAWLNDLDPDDGDAAAGQIGDHPHAEILLESPARLSHVDAKDGPLPQQWSLTSSQNMTFVCRYVVRCHQSPSCLTASAVASHRWSVAFSATPEGYAVRQLDGKVIFRKDVLDRDDEVNNLLGLFIHPIPGGFKRTSPSLGLSSDGSELTYQLVDAQQAMNVNPLGSGITHLDVAESVDVSRGAGPLDLGLNIVPADIFSGGMFGRTLKDLNPFSR